MRRLILLAILFLGGAIQAQGPYLTNGVPNGLAWRSLTEQEKTLFLGGAGLAFATAQELQMAHADLACRQMINDTASVWFKGTSSDLRREMDAFYQMAENMPVPVTKALGYSEMKLSGASRAELDQYRAMARSASLH